MQEPQVTGEEAALLEALGRYHAARTVSRSELGSIPAGVARLADPKINLAAFGVSFAVAVLVESPIIMILSASTALVQGSVQLVGTHVKDVLIVPG